MATKVFSDNSGADFSGVPDARIFDYNPNSNDGSGEDLWITGFEHTVIRFNGLSDGSLSGSTAAGFIIKFVEPYDKEASEIVVEALDAAFVEATVTWNNVGSGTVLGTFAYSGTGDINITGAWLDAHVQDVFDGVVANNGFRIYTTDGYALTYSSQADDGDRPSMIGDVIAGGGGTTYNESVSESFTASESSSGRLARAGSITESITATESSSAIGVLTRNITEAASLSEVQNASAVFNRSASESVTLSESASARLTVLTSINESISLSEASNSSLDGSTYNSEIVEAISSAESSSSIMTRLGAITESVSLNHTQTASAVLASQINEAISASESNSARLSVPVSASESMTLLEAQSARLTATAAVTESISLLDNTGAGITYTRSITEAVTTTESSTSFMVQVYNVAITEALNLIDQVDASLIKKLAKRLIGNAVSLRTAVGNLIKRNIGSDLDEH